MPRKYKARATKPIEERFWSKVLRGGPNECWQWVASLTGPGYGQIWHRSRIALAHRVVYELTYGAIPPGMQIDHLCRNRACVNPAHLEVVTRRTNLLRGTSPSARNARKTHCQRGHPFDAVNTYRDRDNWRSCRTCQRQRRKERST